MRWRALLAVLLVTACGASLPTAARVPLRAPLPPPPASAEPAPEAPVVLSGPPQYRALWVDAFHAGIRSKAEVDQLIKRAHEGNINALFVQVRRAGDAYFLRGVEPEVDDSDLAPPPYDALAYVLYRAHTANPPIEVHAWMNTFYVGNQSQVQRYYRSQWGQRTDDGTAGPYLDPGAPGARAYTQEVFSEVVRRYPVDGVHMDFVRYPEGGNWGYSPDGIAAFNQATGRSGSPDPNDPAFQQWRRDQVTALVKGVHDAVKRIRPSVKVSAALIAYGPGPKSLDDWHRSRSYNEVYQDWVTWMAEGYLDLALVMNYDRDSSPSQHQWYRDWIEFEKDHQGQARLLVGVGAFDNYPEDTFAQVQAALAPSASGNTPLGVAIYSYASTSLYGTDDFYLHPDDQGYLPRQPYAPDRSPAALAARAAQFNGWFWTALSQPSSYTDPALGTVSTRPVFTAPVGVP